jgi:hypothetical protein
VEVSFLTSYTSGATVECLSCRLAFKGIHFFSFSFLLEIDYLLFISQ